MPHLTIACLLAIACTLVTCAQGSDKISLVKTSFKLTYIQDGEKMHKIWLTADADTVSNISSEEGFSIDEGDAITVSASFIDENEDASSIHQPLLRFLNRRTEQDNIYLLKRKGREMKADINLRAEIKSDPEFWNADDVYSIELILGDLKLDQSAIWVITEDMRFASSAKPMFKTATRGVFDFDVGVKKGLLPEFISPLPMPEKRAPVTAVIAALIGVALPLPLLFIAWIRLGVFPLQLPKEGGKRFALFGFEMCLLGHVAALVLFWVKWNIVTTWKVMGVLMIPTVLFGRTVLGQEEEKRRDE